MKTLTSKQKLPLSIDEAWRFFSSPENLKNITPEYMGFDITSALNEKEMYEGMIITYKVKPLLNIPLNWVTEITHIRAPYYFVDNQKAGPFAIWHHQHHFKEIDKGIEMTDIVNYAVPMGGIGQLLASPIVDKKVKHIFDFRYKKLEELFGKA